MKSLEHCKVGDRLIVRNGAKGEQVAVVASVKTLNSCYGHVMGHKWLMRSQRWTGRIAIYPGEVLRHACASDFRQRRVKAAAPIGTK